jgi:hypothetical protein
MRWWPVLLLAVAVHLPGVTGPFILLDDPYYVTGNPLNDHGSLLDVWKTDQLGPAGRIEFFPLRDTIYWVLWRLFGANTLPFHLVNIALHACACLLLLRMGRRLELPDAVNFGGAMLFAVHPMHVESVAWVSGLKDPLFASFALASLTAYLDYRESGRPRDVALSIGFLIASLLSKSIAIAVPVVMLGFELFLPPRPTVTLAVKRLAPPAVVAGVFFAGFVAVAKITAVVIPPHGGSWGANFFLAGWAFARYLQQAFVPLSFQLFYCFPPYGGLLDPRWLGIAGAAAAIAVVVRLSRGRPAVAWGAIWFVAFLLPVMNLVPFPTLMNDRYLYLSVAATSWAMAALIAQLPKPAWRTGLTFALVAVLGLLTVGRTITWHHEEELWREIAEDPACELDDSPIPPTHYLLYASIVPSEEESSAYMRKAAHHPGFAKLPAAERCRQLVPMTRASLEHDRVDDAAFYARAAVEACGAAPPALCAALAEWRNKAPPDRAAALAPAFAACESR